MERDYLFKRKDKKSRYWQLRLETPERKNLRTGEVVHEKSTSITSTKCESYHEAMDFALPRILEHRRSLALSRVIADRDDDAFIDFRKDGISTQMGREIPAGARRPLPDGGYEKASKDGTLIITFDADGEIIGVPRRNLLTMKWSFDRATPEHREIRRLEELAAGPKRDLDEGLLINWAGGGFGTRGKVQSVGIVKDARRAIARLHTVAPKRDLTTLDPANVRAMVQLMMDQECSSGTMNKQVGHLKAMTFAAMSANKSGEGDFPKIKENLWTIRGLVPQGIEGDRAHPTLFGNRELDVIFADLPNWDWQCRLLWMFLYHTGARVGEPFQVSGEEEHLDARCWRYGSKTPECTDRLIPIPPELSELVPDRITGPLFDNGQDKVVFDTMERIRALKLDGRTFADVGTGRTLASLRARFATMADNRECNKDVIKTITGHVPDSFGADADEAARNKRHKKGVWWRYMRGHHPARLLEVMRVAAPIRGLHDLDPS